MLAESSTCSAGKPRVRRRSGPLLQLGRRPMRVKLCARCPYTQRDLAGHYDPEGELYACAKCDGGQKVSTNQYPRKTGRRQECATTLNILGTSPPSVALFATESLVSSATTPGEPPSAQKSALAASRPVKRATTDGYVDFIPQPGKACNEHHAAAFRRSEFRSEEVAQ